jgi:pimeloyl-ACP methyl ester carboxylesterase
MTSPTASSLDPSVGYPPDGAWRRVVARFPEEYRPGSSPATTPEQSWWRWRDCDVHLDTYRPRGADGSPVPAPATLVVLHGGGGNGRLVGALGAMAARAGFVAVVPDLPGYGVTRVPDRRGIRYPDWVALAADLVRAQAGPVVVAGLSVGGMLAYDAVAAAGAPAPVLASCLLDTADPAVRRGIAAHPWLGAAARPVLARLSRADRVLVPVRLLAPMHLIANDRELSRAIVTDPTSGGTRMPLGFFRSYLESRRSPEPERFTGRLVLAHPDADPWTPLELSLRFLHRAPAGTREVVLLERTGHLPFERPGVDRLAGVVARELAAVAATSGGTG